MNNRGNYYSVVYYRPYRELRDRTFISQLHKTRDGLVHLELSPILRKAGFSYAGTILNVPYTVRRDNAAAIRDSEIRTARGDLFVLGTRPPLEDNDKLSRRTVDRSGLPIETRLLAETRKVFSICRRNAVVIQDFIEVCDEYRHVRFGEFNGAPVKSATSKGLPAFTLGYCVWLPAMNERNWHLLTIFGMGGTESVVFAHLLRTKFAKEMSGVLKSKCGRLIIVRFLLAKVVPCPLLAVSAEELEAQVVTDVALEEAAPL